MKQRVQQAGKSFGMHRITALVLALAMLLCCLPLGLFSSAYSTELVENGTFDAGLEAWSVNGDVTADNGYAALVGMDEEGEAQAVLQSAEAEAAAEGNYTLSFDARVAGGGAFSAEAVQLAVDAQSVAGNVAVEIPENVNSGEWVTVTHTFHAASDVVGLAVAFTVVGGTADVDNVSLKRTHTIPVYEAEGELVALKNGDFANRLNDWSVSGEAAASTGYFGKGAALYPQGGTAELRQTVALEANTAYELHYYVKATDAADTVARVTVDPQGDGTTESLVASSVTGNTEWTDMTAQFVTGENASETVIVLSAIGGSSDTKVIFDEIVISKVVSNTMLMALDDEDTTVNLFPEPGFEVDSSYLNQQNPTLATIFESGKVNWGWVDGAASAVNWTVRSATTAEAEKFDGNVLELSHKSNASVPNIQSYFNWEAGKTYTISYWVKTDAVACNTFYLLIGETGLDPVYGDGLKNTLGISWMPSNPCTEWAQVSFDYTANATGNTELRFVMHPGVNGTLSLADVRVTEKKQEVLPDEDTTTNLFPEPGFEVDSSYLNQQNPTLATMFESGKVNWGWVDGAISAVNWTVRPATTAEAEKFDGNVLELSHKSDASTPNIQSYFDWEAGKTYTISYWVKTDAVACNTFYLLIGETGLDPVYGDGLKNTLGISWMPSNPCTEWAQVSFDYTANATGNTELRFVMHPGVNGTLSLADVRVTEKTQEPDDGGDGGDTGENKDEDTAANLFPEPGFEVDSSYLNQQNPTLATMFESGKVNWGWVDGAAKAVNWTVRPATTAEAEKFDGNVLELSYKSDDATPNIQSYFDWEAGKTYTISYWVKTNAVACDTFYLLIGETGLDPVYGDGLKNTLGISWMPSNPCTEWAQVSFEYTANATGNTELRFVMDPGANGTLSLADVRVTEKTQEPDDGGDATGNLFPEPGFEVDSSYLNQQNPTLATMFESGKVNWGWVDGAASAVNWKVRPATTAEAEKFDGNVLELSHKSDASVPNIQSYFNWKAGKTYTISYWVKTDAVACNTFYLFIKEQGLQEVYGDGLKSMLGISWMPSNPCTEWAQVSFNYTANATGNTELRFVMHPGVNGTLSLADVRVTEAAEADAWITNGNFLQGGGTKDWSGITAADLTDGTAAGAERGKALRVTGVATITYRAFTKPIEVGKTYTLRFRMRNDALSGSALGSVYFTKADGTGEMATTKLTASNGIWKEYLVDFVAEEGFENPKLTLQLEAGVVYTLADFSFEEYKNHFTSLENWTVEQNDGKVWGTATMEVEEDATYGEVLKISKPLSDQYFSDFNSEKSVKNLQVGKTYRYTYYYKTDVSTTESYAILKGATTFIPSITKEKQDDGWTKITFTDQTVVGGETPSVAVRVMAAYADSTEVAHVWITNVTVEEVTDAGHASVGFANGDFSLKTGSYPKYWGSVWTDPSADDTDAAVSATGTVTVSDTVGVAGISTVYANVEHRLSFRIKADKTARDNLGLMMTSYKNGNYELITEGNYGTVLVPTLADTDDWQTVEVIFTATEGAQYAAFLFVCSEGSYELDDVNLELWGDARQNFDFEAGDTTPIAWSYSGSGLYSRVAEGYDGGYAAKISGTAGGRLVSANFDLEPNTFYAISWWVKTDMPDMSDIAPMVYFRDENGNASNIDVFTIDPENNYRLSTSGYSLPWVYKVYGSTITTENPDGWQHLRAYFRTGETAAYGYFQLTLNGSADAIWFDDMAVYAEQYAETNEETNELTLARLDFEAVDEAGYPEGWYFGGARDAAPLYERDTTFYHSGSASAHIVMDSLSSHEYLLGTTLIPVDTSGDNCIYEVSFWMSSANATTKEVRLNLWYYDESGTKIFTSDVDALGCSSGGKRYTLGGASERSEWVNVIARLQIPTDVNGNKVVYVAPTFDFTPGEGEIWIDDVFIDRVEDDSNIIVEQNNFHAVDSDGNLSEWYASAGATLSQGTDDAQGTYGRLTVTGDSGYMVHRNIKTATEYQYNYVITYRSDYAVDMQLHYYNYQEQEYTDYLQTFQLPSTDGEWRTEEIRFTTNSGVYLDVWFGIHAKGTLDISQLVMYQIGRSAANLNWEGKWIGYARTAKSSVEYDISYYRHMVYLEDEVAIAPFQITGDDKYKFYVNGTLVFSNMDGGLDIWSNITYLDLQPYLHEGENVIAIALYNHGAYSALLYDGRWTLANGKTVDVLSSPDTLCYNPDGLKVNPDGATESMAASTADTEPDWEWTDVDYDDSSWDRCYSYGAPPINPWGDMFFDSSLYIDNQLELISVEGENDLVRDLTFEFAMTVKLKEAITAKTPVSVVLWEKNSVNSICKLTATLLDHKNVLEWPVGEEFTVHMQVTLPDYLPDGSYTLQLDDTYFLFSNEEVYDNKFINFRNLNDYEPSELESSVEVINGKPTFVVNGELKSEFWFQSNQFCNSQGLATIDDSEIETYLANGAIDFSDMYLSTGTLDFDTIDENINTVLSASPDSIAVISIATYAPIWWLEENPDEAVVSVDSNGVATRMDDVSFGSVKWKEKCAELLDEVIAHMRKQNYYSRIAGFRLAGGETYEFMTIGQTHDFSPCVETYFQNWAKEEYGTIEAVREAWNEPELASFEDITLPTKLEILAAESVGWGEMLNPAEYQKIIDYQLLLDIMTSDCLTYWAHATKEACDYKLVVGAYYGYLWLGPGIGTQHTNMQEILECEDLDFVCSPLAYNERELGESEAMEAVTDSFMAYGKLVMGEQDNRTCLTGQFAGTIWDTASDHAIGRTHTMAETLLQFKRDFGFNIGSGNGLWFYDMFGAWFEDEQIYEFMRDLNAEYDFFNHLVTDTVNDMAVILPSEQAAYIQDSSNSITHTIITLFMYNGHRQHLADMGTCYDVYTLETLVDGKMPKHKVNVFLSTLEMTAEECAAVEKYTMCDDQVNVFLYKSGLVDDEGMALENMQELTGFEIGMLDMNVDNNGVRFNGQSIITNDQTAVTEGLLGDQFGNQSSSAGYLETVLYVIPDEDTVELARSMDTGDITAAMKDMGDWTSIYAYSTNLTAKMYQNIIEMAGGHIYSYEQGDIVWANGSYVAVHSASSGDKTIYLDGDYAVYDVYEEKMVSLNTDTIEYYNEPNDTHLFRLTPVDTYSLLVMTKGGNGTATDAGEVVQMTPGSSKTITFTPDDGYVIKSVTVNGEEVEVTDNRITLSDIHSHNAVVVKFKREPSTREWDEVEDSGDGEDVPSTDETPEDETPEDETPVVNTNPPDEEEPLDNPPASDTGSDYVEQWERQLKWFWLTWWMVAIPVGCLAVIILLIVWLKRRKKKEERAKR